MIKRNKNDCNQRKMTDEEKITFSNKVSFLAGIILILSFVQDAISFYTPLPKLVVFAFFAIAFFLFDMFLAHSVLDKFMRRGVEKFGLVLTILSVVLFILKNIIILSDEKDKMLFLLIGSLGIIGATIILFKEKSNNCIGRLQINSNKKP